MDKLVVYYEGNYSRMCKIAYNVTKQTFDAEDVVQETFSRALKYSKSFNPEISSLHQWVNGIFSRCLKDSQRDARLQGMSVEIKEDDIFTGANIAEDDKTLEEIETMVKSISSTLHKQICYLHFIQEYTPREIRQVIDTTPDTIRGVLKRFRKDLQVVYG